MTLEEKILIKTKIKRVKKDDNRVTLIINYCHKKKIIEEKSGLE